MAKKEDAPMTAYDASWNTETLEALALACNVLSPLFLGDPAKGSAGPVLDALAASDAAELAKNWPFVGADGENVAVQQAIEGALARMIGSLSSGGDRAALAREYRRLFVGPAKLPAPPWGSVYTDKEGIVFGEGNLELRAWLRSQGIARLDDENVPDDHIGNLLSLTAVVATERPDALDELLAVHILPWAPHYLDQLEAAAEHPFYQALAALTRSTLESAGAYRQLQVEEPEFFR